ncbi:MAG: peptidoglycan-binding domain-containing protein [bacterium]|nr:peptidoglycan-binding domain-containing protein [bacterium]
MRSWTRKTLRLLIVTGLAMGLVAPSGVFAAEKPKEGMAAEKPKEGMAAERPKEGKAAEKTKMKAPRKGSPGIAAAQESLKKLGFDPGPADGKMGKKTRAALAAFQKANGLKADGRLTKMTRAKLGEMSK